MKENKPNLPQWVDPGPVKHTWPAPDPKTIISREPPHQVLTKLLTQTIEGVVLEGTDEFNRGFRHG